MRTWLLRLQFGLMRILGIRRLGQDLNSRSDAAFVGLGVHFDTLRADLLERETAMDLRLTHLERALMAVQIGLSALRDEEGGRARSATERGDTLDVTIRDLLGTMAELARAAQDDASRRDGTENFEASLADLRVEVLGLRTDLAREVETITDDVFTASRSLTQAIAQTAGELRAELSCLRADIARGMEASSERTGTMVDRLRATG